MQNPPSRSALCWGCGSNVTTPLVAAEYVPTVYRPRRNNRFITATNLFDGHDAATNLMRRPPQAAINNENTFDALGDAVRRSSVDEIANARFEVGGQCWRNL
jgi:hypothetical protein